MEAQQCAEDEPVDEWDDFFRVSTIGWSADVEATPDQVAQRNHKYAFQLFDNVLPENEENWLISIKNTHMYMMLFHQNGNSKLFNIRYYLSVINKRGYFLSEWIKATGLF